MNFWGDHFEILNIKGRFLGRDSLIHKESTTQNKLSPILARFTFTKSVYGDVGAGKEFLALNMNLRSIPGGCSASSGWMMKQKSVVCGSECHARSVKLKMSPVKALLGNYSREGSYSQSLWEKITGGVLTLRLTSHWHLFMAGITCTPGHSDTAYINTGFRL